MSRFVILVVGLWAFAQTHDGLFPPTVPNQLILEVVETAGVDRPLECVRNGVPLARSQNVLSVNTLAVVDESSQPVPAQFRVLARWDAALTDTTAPIQWVLVSFPVSINANQTRSFRLVTDGSIINPAVASPLSLVTQVSSGTLQAITVDTGAAQFTISDNGKLFTQIAVNSQDLLQNSSQSISLYEPGDVNLQSFSEGTTAEIEIEHQDDLCAIIVVRAPFSMPPRGDAPNGDLTSMRRYTFFWGSAMAQVRQVVQWEGSYCDLRGEWPYYACDDTGSGFNTINALHLTQMPQVLQMSFTPNQVVLRAERGQAPLIGAFANQPCRLIQNLRTDRFQDRSFSAGLGGSLQTGIAADQSYLIANGNTLSLSVAIDHMQNYEPQALSLAANGDLQIETLAGDAWLGPRQGFFSQFGILAQDHGGSATTGTTAEQLLWAPLNHPLRAWPSATWFASSNAVEPFPWLPLEGALAQYDTLIPRVLQNTLDNIHYKGLDGILTFGSLPRYWTDPLRTDELDCDDPTPAYDWDNKYWCSTWTDYHNTFMTVPIWAMRSGQTKWLDDLAFPAALRMLYTQIMRCSSSDGWFYCGQAPAGYQAYRGDFNSSHAYMENLIYYYWFTGDQTVISSLTPGAVSMRDYLCPSRPASPCGPEVVNTDIWASLSGRSAIQWYSLFRMLGLASDFSFYEDYRTNLGREFTQYYVQQTALDDGLDYGFLLMGQQGAWPYYCPPWRDPNNPSDNPNRVYYSDQLWMASLYDFNMLYRYRQDTDDAPLGQPLVAPSDMIVAWARTLNRFGGNVLGAGGSPNGDWPNMLTLLYDESNRIGGIMNDPCTTNHPADNAICINRNPNTASSLPAANPSAPCVEALLGGGDPLLYDTGKSILCGTVVRAGLMAQDPELIQLGRDLTGYALSTSWGAANNQGGNQTLGSPYGMALGKIMGEYLARLHSAVALLAAYDANQIPCDYPNLVGSSALTCEDVDYLVSLWMNPAAAPAEDRNGNQLIDVYELVLLMNCVSSCP